MELVTYYVTNYGYPAIFLLLLPGAFGLPIPDELLLTLTGYLALRGDLRLLPAMAVVVSGAVLGVTLDYWVGRAAGARLIGESGAFFRLRPDKFKNLQEWLQRGGGWRLCPGYFLPGVRHWVAIAAGITRFPVAGFTRFAYLGVLAWSLSYILLGYFLGREASLLVERIGVHCRWATGLIAALLLGYVLIRGKWLRLKWPKSRVKSLKVIP
ncbi:MAG: DedA family protein [Desulfobaccales bacterium]